MDKMSHFIECPRYGGKRPAPACIHYDRYKSCRRHCKSLEAYIKNTPNYQEIVDSCYAKKEEKPEETVFQTTLFGGLATKHSGKGVPDFELSCQLCSFIGKSKRGLLIHLRRTHKMLKPKKK